MFSEFHAWALFRHYFLGQETKPIFLDTSPSVEQIESKFRNVSERMVKTAGQVLDLSIDVRFTDSSEQDAYSQIIDKKCNVTIPKGLWDRHGGFIRYDRESEFAAVLGHEIGHCIVSISPKKIKLWNDIFSDPVRRRPFSPQVLSMMMFFRRGFELDADKIGVQLMKESGYDPNAAREIWCRRSDSQRVSEPFDLRSIFLEAERKALELQYPINLDDHPSAEERCVELTRLLP
jgi:predicted Zn-dependent protease